jgi:hypothetical protein
LRVFSRHSRPFLLRFAILLPVGYWQSGLHLSLDCNCIVLHSAPGPFLAAVLRRASARPFQSSETAASSAGDFFPGSSCFSAALLFFKLLFWPYDPLCCLVASLVVKCVETVPAAVSGGRPRRVGRALLQRVARELVCDIIRHSVPFMKSVVWLSCSPERLRLRD